MTADEFCEMSRSDREKYMWERNFDFQETPDFAVEEKAEPPTEEEDAAFQLERRESGAGRYNPRED